MSVRDDLLVRVADHPRAWTIRRRWLSLRFGMSRRRFGVAYGTKEAAARARAVPDLIKNAVAPVVIAVGLVVAMAAADSATRSAVKSFGWPTPNPGTYDVLLEAVAGVTGVFLALYFTAVSTVAASVYVNVPHDIRALIVRDRLGGIYVAGTAFTTALSVTLLIAHTLTSSTYELAAPVIGLFTAFSIFSFIRLGQRAFYLADPTRLGGAIATEFFSWFRRATPQGWRWRDPSFQEHYRVRAEQSITSLKSLVAIADDQPHLRGSSVRQLCAHVSNVLTTYLRYRDRVPTKSRWFGERYEHKQWFLTDSTELDMATATATQLQPKVVPNVAWVEAELLPALDGVVITAVANGDLEEAFQVLSGMEPVFSGLGQRWELGTAKKHIEDLTISILDGLLQRPDTNDIGQTVGAIAVFDALAMLPMAAELGFHRYVAQDPAPHLRIPTMDALAASEGPYQLDLPRAVVETVEQLQGARTFERAVRAPAPTRTPDWYVREIATNTYETQLKEEVTAALELLRSWYPQISSRLAESRLSGPLGAVLVRGLEVCWKLERHVSEWQAIAAAVRPVPTLVDVVRPEWDWDAANKTVDDLRRDLLHRLTTVVGMQAFRQRDPSLPDYLGGAVHWMGEACIDALLANDDEMFADLFPTYFVGLLLIVNGIQEQIASWQPSIAVTAMAEPIVDLMEVSGFAYIFSELHGNPKIWEACRSRWETYLGESTGAEYLKRIASMHYFHRHQFAITHRAPMRTRWEQAAHRVLSRVPRREPKSWHDYGEVEHESRLIRRIAPRPHDLGSPFDPSDVFVVLYLAQRPEATGLDFGVADWVARELVDDEEEPLDSGESEEDKP